MPPRVQTADWVSLIVSHRALLSLTSSLWHPVRGRAQGRCSLVCAPHPLSPALPVAHRHFPKAEIEAQRSYTPKQVAGEQQSGDTNSASHDPRGLPPLSPDRHMGRGGGGMSLCHLSGQSSVSICLLPPLCSAHSQAWAASFRSRSGYWDLPVTHQLQMSSCKVT